MTRLLPKTVALSLLLSLLGCSSAVGGRLTEAHEAQRVPERLEVVWDARSPAWGGERITVRGDGAVSRAAYRPGFVATGADDDPLETVEGREVEGVESFEGRAPVEPVAALLALLVELEAWKQRAAEESGRLDSGRATLTVRVGDAEAEVWEYFDDLEANQRLVRVREAMTSVVRAAEPIIGDPGGTSDGAPSPDESP